MNHPTIPHTDSVPIGIYLLNALYNRGVKHIFGVPGDYTLKFNKQIEQHTIQFINTTRENTAGYMADAYARLHGLGVASITYGVGINITNALAQASVESSPLIVISGSAGREEFIENIRLHHSLDKLSNKPCNTQLEIFKYVTYGQAVLNDPLTAKQQIDELIALCLQLKKPVYLELPRDMVDIPISQEGSHLSKENSHSVFFPSVPSTETIGKLSQELALTLKNCQQPVIWAGHEIQRYQLSAQLLKFAGHYNIPIVTTLLGKSVIDEHHPLCLGVYQGGMSRPEIVSFMDSCDCLFMLGVMLTDVETGIFSAKFDHDQQIIAQAESCQINTHEYGVRLTDFMKLLSESNYPTALKIRSLPKLPATSFKAFPNAKITTKRVFECLQAHLKPEHIVVADVGDCLFGSADLILGQNAFLACAHFGSLGFGTPGCIGAQFAESGRRVIGLIGDGAFQMTSMELSTAVRYQLDPIILLFNNHGYGTERPLLDGNYNDIHNWNYAKIPEVLEGGMGFKVKTETDFENALKEALERRGEFYLIEIELDKTDFSQALQRFGQLAKNK